MDRPTSWNEAVEAFVSLEHSTQSSRHIKPLHRYCVDRLVFEGGFRPELISPRPPYVSHPKNDDGAYELVYDATAAFGGEQTVLGGLKTKDIDVVVSQRSIGPALAISVKGTLNAFRNLTNRMEEAAGDCTNIHIAYPSLVYGFLHVIRALNASEALNANDIAIDQNGAVVDSIRRYHDAMSRIAGRKDLRNDVSKYEAIACVLIQRKDGVLHEFASYPSSDSKLRFEEFFQKLYNDYDLRYVFPAPKLEKDTRRVTWIENDVTQHGLKSGFIVRLE